MTARPPLPLPGPGAPAAPVLPLGERDNLRGLIWAVASMLGASLMALAVRGVATELDSRMVVMFRAGLTSILALVALILFASLRKRLCFSKPWHHILRGILIGVSTNLGFYTIMHLPLATATVLFFTAPIFATILGVMVHKERVGMRRISAVIAGFVGALVILRPGLGGFQPAMLTALASAGLFAVALTLSRGLANADGVLSTYLSSVVISVVVTLPIALPVWKIPSQPIVWTAIGVLVVASAVRGFADIQSYRYADAALIAPVAYLRLVLIGIGAFFLFSEGIDRATLIGAAIIIGATFYIAHRETAAAKKASSADKAA